jgi:hypothetical protein
MKKAQISLEMIIMLVVLLVLAGVVITLILHFLRPGAITPPEQALAKRDFLAACERFCKDKESVDYCRYYWNGKDWNENKINSEVIKVGKYEWYACEDRIYCFLIYPCEDRFGSGLETMKKCKQLLCQIYTEKYGGDIAKASEVLLKEVITFSPQCSYEKFNDTTPPDENWYDLVFAKGCK